MGPVGRHTGLELRDFDAQNYMKLFSFPWSEYVAGEGLKYLYNNFTGKLGFFVLFFFLVIKLSISMPIPHVAAVAYILPHVHSVTGPF